MDILRPLFDPRGYFFWLIVVSVACAAAERIRPWRRSQPALRPQIGQDLFWLVFNGHFAGILVARGIQAGAEWAIPGMSRIREIHLLGTHPVWFQAAVFFVAKDFLEWCVHNFLHRVRWLWTFHKLHHSILQLDWIGSFRFHWMEIVVYRSLTYLPMMILGVDGGVILWVAVAATLIGHLNHSNLDITWGPLRYVFNSPRMHVWHHMHDLPPNHPKGLNFGISLSLWDWIFGTAWWPDPAECPEQQPRALGFPGQEAFPRSLFRRLIYPIGEILPRNAVR